jgi:C-terminal processing protease CtpA/Prc
VAELESRLGERREPGGLPPGMGDERLAAVRERFGENGRPDPAAMRERARERQQQRLIEAGFTAERAAWIERRTQELEVQAMQARYEAQRNGRPGQGVVDAQAALRSELGDAEYERYLTGTGRPTEVQVMDVLASSPAEKAGLQAGDQIVSYAGTRVFDMRELEALTRQGTPGESVTVEVKRNGQSVQVQVQRGVLGVEGGGRGGPPGGRGPGGFGRP